MAVKSLLKRRRAYLLILIAFGLALYVILPQIKSFRASWHLLLHPDLSLSVSAVCFAALTYFAAAATYKFLAFSPLVYDRLVVVQLAAMFLNRLLPGGLGALGTNFIYLKNNQHSTPQATLVVSMNNLIGLSGHLILLILLFMLYPDKAEFSLGDPSSDLVKVGLIILLTVVVIVSVIAKKNLRNFTSDLQRQLTSYRRRPVALIKALMSSVSLTFFNVLCLYCCLLAMSINVSFVTVMVIFTAGISAATVTPTPGGLGGFEAALVAVMVASGIAAPTALAAALLFRLITYWLALAAGVIALIYAERQRWLSV